MKSSAVYYILFSAYPRFFLIKRQEGTLGRLGDERRQKRLSYAWVRVMSHFELANDLFFPKGDGDIIELKRNRSLTDGSISKWRISP
jgi:hypothetical protein